VLLLKDDGYVFKDSVRKLPQIVLPLRDTFELNIRIDLSQAARRLKLLRASLLDKVAEHQLDLEAVLGVCECAIRLEVQLHSEVAHVVELYLLFLVADHERPRVEAELRLVELCREDVVMILLLTLAFGANGSLAATLL